MNGAVIFLVAVLFGSEPLVAPAAAYPAWSPPAADTLPPVGRPGLETLEFPPLVFDPPDADEHQVLGVTIFHFHDPALPLVDLFVQVRGGPSHLPRERMAAATALPGLLQTGGTHDLHPDSVETRMDLLAVQLSFGGGGGGSFAAMNALTHTLDEALPLFRDLLARPGFDAEALEVWRGRELDRVRRRPDDPVGLAYSEFNRLIFGDHPVGWITEEEDLTEERLSPETLAEVHRRFFCRENVILGVVGDLTWEDAEPRIRDLLEPWPACEEDLPEPPLPEMRREAAVFVLPREVDQTTIVMAHPGGIRQEDSPEFFASRVADRILGGAGLTSRLMDRLRTEMGLTYGASSLWTAPIRHEGLVGAVTSTRPDRTVEATRTLLQILEEFRERPPTEEEVARTRDEIANGYVFAFESPAQIVARRMGYRSLDLPDGWLERYLEGVLAVNPEDAARVVRAHLRPDRMTILLVGDPERFDPGLEELGRVYRISPEGRYEEW